MAFFKTEVINISTENVVNFGKRRIQQNKYTYLVPLPPAWIKTMGLHQGDSVQIVLTDKQNLKIIPAAASKLRSEQN